MESVSIMVDGKTYDRADNVGAKPHVEVGVAGVSSAAEADAAEVDARPKPTLVINRRNPKSMKELKAAMARGHGADTDPGSPNSTSNLKRALSTGVLNIVFQHSSRGWLKTVLPLAEFLLLLIAIILFVEIAPNDMPATCESSLLQSCLSTFIVAGGAQDSALVENDCGHARVQCWRSGLKEMLYQGKELPAGATTIDVDALDIPTNVLTMYKPDLVFCMCLLSNNGNSELPSSSDAWRSDTDYFCDVVETVNRGIGISGLLLACLIITVKAMLEEEDGNTAMEDEEDLTAIPLVSFVTVFWFVWSCIVVSETRQYADPTAAADVKCVLPDANILSYVFVIGTMSCLGSVYALWVIVRVVYHEHKKVD